MMPLFSQKNLCCWSIWSNPSNYGLTIYMFGATTSFFGQALFKTVLPQILSVKKRENQIFVLPLYNASKNVIKAPEAYLIISTHFRPILHFHTPWKRQKA